MSAALAAVPVSECTTPEATSTPICAPELVEGHPETPLIALLGLMHLRIARFLFVLGRGWGGDDRRIDDRPLAHQQTALLQHRAGLVEQAFGRLVRLQPMARMQH